MTSIARAEGSKSSNKKKCEDATQWQELKNSKPKNKIGKKKDFVIEDGTKVRVFKTHGKEVKSSKPKNKIGKKKDFVIEDGTKVIDFETHGKELKSSKPKNKIGKKKDLVIEDGKRVIVIKPHDKEVKRPYCDLPFMENEKFLPKKSLEEKGLDKKTIAKMMLTKERKAHSALRVELQREQISKASAGEGGQNGLKIDKPRFKHHFQENDVMAKYEHHWVLKESVFKLQSINFKIMLQIIDARTDGNEDFRLTKDEVITLQRLMTKEKRWEHELLINRLRHEALAQNGPSDDMVKFYGFWVKKDLAEILERLREKLLKNGVSEEEIQNKIKDELMKVMIYLRGGKKQCLRCRQTGHMFSLCPQNLTGLETCIKCCSADHLARNCPLNKAGTGNAYTTCFVCNEVGHICRDCPDNPKGAYRNGGCCNECGSVRHYSDECPERMVEGPKEIIKLPRLLAKRKKESIEEEDLSKEEQEQASKIKIKKEKRKKAKTLAF